MNYSKGGGGGWTGRRDCKERSCTPKARFPPWRERRMPLDAVSVRRTPTRRRKLTNSYAHQVIRHLPYDNDYIFFENAPGEIILLKKYTA